MNKKSRKIKDASLICHTTFRVRFSEVDSMNIVWHGDYVRYFEDGREAFGREYPGLSYQDIYKSGFLTPIVELNVSYKHPLTVDDTAIVETRFIDTPAAKICFEYIIRRESDGVVIATGNSVQVFIDENKELQLLSPVFYENWKKKWIVK